METFYDAHLHTNRSVRDAIDTPEEMVIASKNAGNRRIVVTEHGNLGSLYEVKQACDKHNMEFSAGIEFYIILDKYKDVTKEKSKQPTTGTVVMKPLTKTKHLVKDFTNNLTDYHITVQVLNETGYKNLLKLIYLSHSKAGEIDIEGFTGCHYVRPRITEKMLFHFQEGLLVSSGCRLSIFASYLYNDMDFEAYSLLNEFRENIDNFYIELHPHHNEVEEKLFHKLKKYALDNDVPMIVASDAHYAVEGNVDNWNLLNGVRHGVTYFSEDKIKNDDFYVKGFDKTYKRVLELNNNDRKITNKCFEGFDLIDDKFTFKWNDSSKNVPRLRIPKSKIILTEVLNQRLKELFGNKEENIPQRYLTRLNEEKKALEETDNWDYFMQGYKMITFAEHKNILIGMGRGSAGSLLTSYLLGLTKFDPMLYGLISERAMNTDRKTLMDIDYDFSKKDAPIIIDYLKQEYGHACVTNICNWGFNKISNSIQSVFRYLQIDRDTATKISKDVKKAIKFTGGEDLDHIVEDDEIYASELNKDEEKACHILYNHPLIKNYNSNGITGKKILEYVQSILGTVNNVSVHAAGMLILPYPIYESSIPVIRVNNTICSNFDMNNLKEIGALKIDILRIKTLDLIQSTFEDLEEDGII